MIMARVRGVSVGADVDGVNAAVWCVTQDGRLYKLVSGIWQKNHDANHVEEVAVGNEGHVWCRNRSGHLFRARFPRDFYTQWEPVTYPGNGLRSISAAGDGTIWIVNGQGQVATRVDGQWNTHINVNTAEVVTTGGSGRVCYVDNNGFLLELLSGTGGPKWTRMPNPEVGGEAIPLKSISQGPDGVVWAASMNDHLFKRGANDQVWRANPIGLAVQISTASRNLVWCVNRDGYIFKAETNRFDTNWKQVNNPGAGVYTVKQGDQLLEIIRALCPASSSDALASMKQEAVMLNNLQRDGDLIFPGQVLLIPECR
jgi:hypothetical protein